MAQEVIDSIELRYRQGASDKVYKAAVERSGDGCVVNFAYGRRGAALNTGSKTKQPVPCAEALAIYRKLVASKTAKGYNVFAPGAANGETAAGIATAADAGRDTGLRPQLLNPVNETEAEAYLADSRWCVQEKYDGRRTLLVKGSTGTFAAANRKGLLIAHGGTVEAALADVPGPFVIDGELVGETLYAFDLLQSPAGDMRKLPYSRRLYELESRFGGIKSAAFTVAPAITGSSAKRAFVESLKAAGREGAVFKDRLAPWTAGRPASGGPALKLKFWETCSCIVTAAHAGRRSVGLALGGCGVGNVTVPPNFGMPEPGQVVEVRYLYVTGPGGSLYQPVYLGPRDDIDPDDCTVERQRLKYKAAA